MFSFITRRIEALMTFLHTVFVVGNARKGHPVQLLVFLTRPIQQKEIDRLQPSVWSAMLHLDGWNPDAIHALLRRRIAYEGRTLVAFHRIDLSADTELRDTCLSFYAGDPRVLLSAVAHDWHQAFESVAGRGHGVTPETMELHRFQLRQIDKQTIKFFEHVKACVRQAAGIEEFAA